MNQSYTRSDVTRRRVTPIVCAACAKPIGDPKYAQLVMSYSDIQEAGASKGLLGWRAMHDACVDKLYATGADFYWISLDELVDNLRRLEWDEHLREKNWITYTNWPTWRERLAYPLDARTRPLGEVN